MDQTGDYYIDASRDRVWQALNDPDVLARCIDGCQAMRKLNDDQYQAKVKAKVGPVSAAFALDLAISNAQPPESYRIDGSVKGGAAGFGKGSADVTLEEEGDGTRLRYTVAATVGGKLAQIGSRLLDGAARKMADDFFSTFSEVVTGSAPPSLAPFATVDAADSAAPETEASREWVIWALAFGALAIALILAL